MSVHDSGGQSEGFSDRYRKAFAAIGQPLQAKDALSEEFLEKSLSKSVLLPQALHDFYSVAGNEKQLNHCFNRLLSPEDIFLDTGRIVFMEENQSAVYWGLSASGLNANPLIEQGANVDSESLDWNAESIDCATFLEVHLYLQASFGGGFKHSVTAPISAENQQSLGQQIRIVGRMADLTAYARDHCAICVMKLEDGLQIFAGFHSRKIQDEVARELNFIVKWEDL